MSKDQTTFFPDLEQPETVATASATPKPARYKRDPELEEIVAARTAGTFGDHAVMFSRLRTAAGGYFQTRADGKTYKRDPALKITIKDVGADDQPDARLVIHPGISISGGRANRQVKVDGARIVLTLCHCFVRSEGTEWRERITVILTPDAPARTGRCYLRSSDVDASRLCAIASRFLEDPSAAVAASGTNCAFCGRGLTDSQSRVRGIGPECFGYFGDFLRWIGPAPECN